MKDRIVLEHTFDQKFCRETADSIKKEIKRKKFRITRTVILTKNCPEQYIRLTGLNRINMLLEPKISAAINLEREYFEPQIFDYIDGDSTVFEKEPLTKLAAEGQLMSFSHRGYWQCMDTKREMDTLEKLQEMYRRVARWSWQASHAQHFSNT